MWRSPATRRMSTRHRSSSMKRLLGGTDLRFPSLQPDTSWRCEATDSRLACVAVCSFASRLSLQVLGGETARSVGDNIKSARRRAEAVIEAPTRYDEVKPTQSRASGHEGFTCGWRRNGITSINSPPFQRPDRYFIGFTAFQRKLWPVQWSFQRSGRTVVQFSVWVSTTADLDVGHAGRSYPTWGFSSPLRRHCCHSIGASGSSAAARRRAGQRRLSVKLCSWNSHHHHHHSSRVRRQLVLNQNGKTMRVKKSQGSEDYRSAQEIFDDCFSTVTGARKESSDSITKESQSGVGVVERSSRPLCRPTSHERKVRSLVLDTRYNRLLLVKSKMSEVESLQKGVIRANSLPSIRRRSRFKWVSFSA